MVMLKSCSPRLTEDAHGHLDQRLCVSVSLAALRARCAAAPRRRQDRAGADHGRAPCRPPRAGAAGKRRARHVVVSIFVNPAQFAPHEDLATYPRTFDADLAALAECRRRSGLGAAGRRHVSARISPPASCRRARRPSASRIASGRISSPASPPSSSKLLIQCQPDFAMFGEKDYQQLKVVTRMAKDLDLPVKIVGVPTVREPDGLALSSRNAYLSASDRRSGPVLHRVLKECAAGSRRRPHSRACSTKAAWRSSRRVHARLSRGPHTPTRSSRSRAANDAPIRLLVAARIGKTRLIDNVGV